MLAVFWAMFKIGLFSIGGGYAMIPLIQAEMVSGGYMTALEVQDMVAISQMTPGPLAVNAATFVGMRTFGVPGAILSTLGVVLPSVIIALLVASLFFRSMNRPGVQGVMSGVRPIAMGLIGAAAITFAIQSTFVGGTLDIAALLIFAGIAAISWLKKPSPTLLILLSGAAGILIYGPVFR